MISLLAIIALVVTVKAGTIENRSETPPNILLETETPPNVLIETETPPNILIETETPPNIPIETETPPNIPIETETPPNIPIETETPPNVLIETETPPNVLIETETPPNIPIETETSPNILIETDTPPNIPIETETPPNILIETETPPNILIETETLPNILIETIKCVQSETELSDLCLRLDTKHGVEIAKLKIEKDIEEEMFVGSLYGAEGTTLNNDSYIDITLDNETATVLISAPPDAELYYLVCKWGGLEDGLTGCKNPPKASNDTVPDDEPEIAFRDCSFPFKYLGKTYSSCTTAGTENEKLWCAFDVDSSEDMYGTGKWVWCDDKGASLGYRKCKYEKRTYNRCTAADFDSPWCYFEQKYGAWGYC